jgi:hypothetical protein
MHVRELEWVWDAFRLSSLYVDAHNSETKKAGQTEFNGTAHNDQSKSSRKVDAYTKPFLTSYFSCNLHIIFNIFSLHNKNILNNVKTQ